MDRAAAEDLGLPTLLLMENAGRGAADVLLRAHSARLDDVVIVGGVGQNGGDAWVVARHLVLAGHRPRCFVVTPDGSRCVGDAAVMMQALVRMGLVVEELRSSTDALARALESAALVVDGLFGTGLSRPIDGIHASVVECIGASGVTVVALDLPSGIDADDGAVLGVSIRAEATLTFGAEKRGLHAPPGFLHAGEVSVVSIGAGLPASAGAFVVEPADVAARIPVRSLDEHKGTAGHVLVVGGASGTTGAALLAARGAMRAGAGLVTLAATPDSRPSFDQRVLEAMTKSYESIDELLSLARGKRAVVLGPGLGLSPARRELVRELVLRCEVPLVLDADALTLLAELGIESASGDPAPRVLTPHPGEAARLLGLGTAEVQANRFEAARRLAERSGQGVVLKGARSVVTAPGQPLYVCEHGTPALGVGGSGDVLSGVVGALLGADANCLDVAAAVTLHAMAGEAAARTDRGLLASEIADAIPGTLAAIRSDASLARARPVR